MTKDEAYKKIDAAVAAGEKQLTAKENKLHEASEALAAEQAAMQAAVAVGNDEDYRKHYAMAEYYKARLDAIKNERLAAFTVEQADIMIMDINAQLAKEYRAGLENIMKALQQISAENSAMLAEYRAAVEHRLQLAHCAGVSEAVLQDYKLPVDNYFLSSRRNDFACLARVYRTKLEG